MSYRDLIWGALPARRLFLALVIACLTPIPAKAADAKQVRNTLEFRSVLAEVAPHEQTFTDSKQVTPQPIQPDPMKLSCGDSKEVQSGTPSAEVTFQFPADSTIEQNGTNCCRYAENKCLDQLRSWLKSTSPEANCKGCRNCARCGAKLTGCESFKHMASTPVVGLCTWYGSNPVKECRYECTVEQSALITIGCTECQHSEKSSPETAPAAATQFKGGESTW